MKHIRLACRNDIDQIDKLRITEFQRSAQFVLLKPEKLKWNCCDDTSLVLAAWDGMRAVATMRGVVIFDMAAAENCVQCSVPAGTKFPAIVFNSAATHWDFRGIGLNQLLRYHFLNIALHCEIHSLLSPMYQGAPRIQFMKGLGYRFTVPSDSWQNKLEPKARRVLGILIRNRMPRAKALIENKRQDIIKNYPWQGKFVGLEHCAFDRVDRSVVRKPG